MVDNVKNDINETNDLLKDKQKIVYRTSMLTKFMMLLLITAVAGLTYITIFAPHGIIKQVKLNQQNDNNFAALRFENNQLKQKINIIESEQLALSSTVKLLNPSQTSLLLSQINALINGANQSVLIYHDYVGAIQLLKATQQLLATTNEPLFMQLKIDVTGDLENMLAKNNFDTVVLQTQINNLSVMLPKLKTNLTLNNPQPNSTSTTWQKFTNNIKTTMGNLIKVKQINSNARDVVDIPENEQVVNQKMQLAILNLHQALLTHNQVIWDSSVANIALFLREFYLADNNTQMMEVIVKELSNVNFNANSTNINNTLSSLSKANQLYSGK